MTSSRAFRALLAMASAFSIVAVPLASAGTLTAPDAARTALAAVPQPTVTGPLTGGVHGWPFMGLLSVPRGYVQEEYLVSGMARPYYGPSVFAQRPVRVAGVCESIPEGVRLAERSIDTGAALERLDHLVRASQARKVAS